MARSCEAEMMSLAEREYQLLTEAPPAVANPGVEREPARPGSN